MSPAREPVNLPRVSLSPLPKKNMLSDNGLNIELTEEELIMGENNGRTFMMVPLESQKKETDLERSFAYLRNNANKISTNESDTPFTIEGNMNMENGKSHSDGNIIEETRGKVSEKLLQRKINNHELVRLTDYSWTGKSIPSLFEITSLILDNDEAVKFLVSTEVLKPDSCCPTCGGTYLIIVFPTNSCQIER